MSFMVDGGLCGERIERRKKRELINFHSGIRTFDFKRT